MIYIFKYMFMYLLKYVHANSWEIFYGMTKNNSKN